jgi:hypothetical protein
MSERETSERDILPLNITASGEALQLTLLVRIGEGDDSTVTDGRLFKSNEST